MKELRILTVNMIKLLPFILINWTSYDPGVSHCKAYFSILYLNPWFLLNCLQLFYLLLKLRALDLNYPYAFLNIFVHRAPSSYPLSIDIKSFSKSLFLRIVSTQPVRKICTSLFLQTSFSAHWFQLSLLYSICQMFQLPVYQQLLFFIIYSSHKMCSLFELYNSAPLLVSSTESLLSFVESGNICCSYRNRKQFIPLVFILSQRKKCKQLLS